MQTCCVSSDESHCVPVPSSFTLAAGCVSYNNLTSIEWLFSGSGDHQFDVYRMMREETRCVSSTWGHCSHPQGVGWVGTGETIDHP